MIGDFENGQDVVDLRAFAGIGGLDEAPRFAPQVGAERGGRLGAAAGGVASADVLTLSGLVLTRLDAGAFLIA